MIKKPTLIVLLCAVVLIGTIYYFNWKSGAHPNSPEDTTKLAFPIPASDVTSVTVTHPAKPSEPPVQLVKQNGSWTIVQPLQTGADEGSIEGIVDGLTDARISGTEPGGADRLKVYGLAPAQLTINFEARNGAKHTVELGNKDFTGSSVYSVVDGGKGVDLLPESLLVSSDKTLDELRDRNVLHITPADVTSLDLRNPAGDLGMSRDKTGWKFTRPAANRADDDGVSALLSAVSEARMTAIVSENPENLGKYGLANPAITLTTVDNKGKSSRLLIGKKEGDDYYARDASRSTIFRINAALYAKVAENYNDLRDKKLAEFDQNDIKRVEIHDASGTIIVNKDSNDAWTFEAPASEKGKRADPSKIFSAITSARATEIIARPAADIKSKMGKPAIEAILTSKDGKQLILRISSESGGFVYAEANDRSGTYKLNKDILDSLNVKTADLAF